MVMHGKVTHTAIADDVRHAIGARFAESDRPDVFAALERCRLGRDTARVHRAILVLSACDLREVERLVESASDDYRKLIHLAEAEPGMAERYRRLGLQVLPSR
jgi:hypothetical protein